MSTAQPPSAGAATGADSYTLQCQFCLTWNRVAADRVADRPKCGKCAKPMLLDRPYPIFEEGFARTITDTTLPVLVDFYADWCGPCKMMAPFVDELEREYQGRALIAKVDSDRAPGLGQQYGIRGIPTTIVFKGGKEVQRQVGAVGKGQLKAMLDGAF